MRSFRALLLLTLVSTISTFSQDGPVHGPAQELAKPPLEARIASFDVLDAILRDGLSELSLKNIDGFHLGFEEIIREKIQDDPRALSPHFSLHLRDKTLRQLLDALCMSDGRYTWSEDGASINVYPEKGEKIRPIF